MIVARFGLLAIAALVGVAFGLRYLTARAWTSYHAAVAGRGWEDLDPNLQAIVLGLVRIAGGCFLTLGFAIGFLTLAWAGGAAWAPWAILTITATGLGPAFVTAIKLRDIRPDAGAPVLPALLAFGLVIAGTAIASLG